MLLKISFPPNSGHLGFNNQISFLNSSSEFLTCRMEKKKIRLSLPRNVYYYYKGLMGEDSLYLAKEHTSCARPIIVSS